MGSTRAEDTGHLLSVSTPIGKAYQVPARYFVRRILPPLHPDLDLSTRAGNGVFEYAFTMQGKLWGYNKKNPSRHHRKDVKKAFLWLQRGVRTIVNAIKEIDPVLAFHNNANGQSGFEQRTDDYLPDAFFLPVSAVPGSVQWSDIAVLGEYQRADSTESVEENIKKISQSISDCMRRDPRRRFVYAFTAEDANMKLWYCDRSQILVSEPFNFIQDYSILLRFVLAISFAEFHRLGWDPTLTVVNSDGHTQYDITVCSEQAESVVYRTLEVLSDSSTRHVLGRGTRVWKAVKIVDGEASGEPVALKDAWVDGGRQREGDIHSQIMRSDFLVKEHSELQRYIVSVQTHGDVFVADVQDRTPTFFHAVSPSAEEIHPGTASHASRPQRAPSATTTILPFQVHYRIVYGEVGAPLADVTSLRTIFSALADVTFGLIAMHRSGWVHRDLSVGNILIHDGVGKITDLEYATSDARLSNTGRTGTAFFVAAEVDSQEYLFRPHPTRAKTELRDPQLFQRLMRSGSEGLEDVLSPPRFIYPEEHGLDFEFRYNPLHDLESLWWIAVFFILNKEIDDDEDEGEYLSNRELAQREAASEFFYQRDQRRTALLYSNHYFIRHLKHLRPSLAEISPILDEILVILRQAYREAEKSIRSITFDVADGVYGRIRVLLERVAALVQEDLRIRKFTALGERSGTEWTLW